MSGSGTIEHTHSWRRGRGRLSWGQPVPLLEWVCVCDERRWRPEDASPEPLTVGQKVVIDPAEWDYGGDPPEHGYVTAVYEDTAAVKYWTPPHLRDDPETNPEWGGWQEAEFPLESLSPTR